MIVDLAGEVFYRAENEGVLAVVHSAVRVNSDRMFQILGSKKLENVLADADSIMRVIGHLDKPVFTFVGEEGERVQNPWFTGSRDMGIALIAFIVESGGSVRTLDIPVPFSNGYETGVWREEKDHPMMSRNWLRERQLAELRYVTSEDQFLRTFGISTSIIKNRVPG